MHTVVLETSEAETDPAYQPRLSVSCRTDIDGSVTEIHACPKSDMGFYFYLLGTPLRFLVFLYYMTLIFFGPCSTELFSYCK